MDDTDWDNCEMHIMVARDPEYVSINEEMIQRGCYIHYNQLKKYTAVNWEISDNV